jgi:hypothetical protein
LLVHKQARNDERHPHPGKNDGRLRKNDGGLPGRTTAGFGKNDGRLREERRPAQEMTTAALGTTASTRYRSDVSFVRHGKRALKVSRFRCR